MSDTSASLAKSRLFFLGIVGAIILVVLFINRHALFSHPSHHQPSLPSQDIPEETPVESVTFSIFDTETTGVDPAIHRLVELAVVKYRNGEILDEHTWLVNPERFIPEEAEDVHGISAEMVENEPPFAEIYPEFIAFTDQTVLMAHNSSFDIKFLQSEFKRAGVPSPGNAVVDSLALFRAWHPGWESYSLEAIANRVHVSKEGTFHRAKDDSVYVGKIFYKDLDLRGEKMTLGQLYEAAGGKRTL